MRKLVVSDLGITAYLLISGIFFGLLIALLASGTSDFSYITFPLAFCLGFICPVFILEKETT